MTAMASEQSPPPPSSSPLPPPLMRLPRDLHIQLLRLIPFRHVPALLRVSRYFRDLASAADLERLRRQDYRAMPWKERRPPGACAAEWDEVVRAQERVPAWRIRSRPDSKAARRRSKDRADRLLQDEPYLPLAQWEQRLMGMTLVAEDQVGDETTFKKSDLTEDLAGVYNFVGNAQYYGIFFNKNRLNIKLSPRRYVANLCYG